MLDYKTNIYVILLTIHLHLVTHLLNSKDTSSTFSRTIKATKFKKTVSDLPVIQKQKFYLHTFDKFSRYSNADIIREKSLAMKKFIQQVYLVPQSESLATVMMNS